MDIFIRNIPDSVRERHLREFLADKLKQFDCLAFEVEKFKSGNRARLTLPSKDVATRFLALHGVPEQQSRWAKPALPLMMLAKTLFLSKDKFTSDPLLFQCLRKEDAERRSKRSAAGTENVPKLANITTFSISHVDCGIWQHRGSEASGFFFQSFYRDPQHASLILGKKSLVVMLYADQHLPERIRLDIDYRIVEHIALSSLPTPAATLTLCEAPRFCKLEEEPEDDPETNDADLSGLLRVLTLAQARDTSRRQTRLRAANLHPDHAAAAGRCLVYRLSLSDHHLVVTLVRSHVAC